LLKQTSSDINKLQFDKPSFKEHNVEIERFLILWTLLFHL